MDIIQEGEVLNIIAILKKSELTDSKTFSVSLFKTLEEEKSSHSLEFDPSMIKKDDDFIFSLAANELIKRASRDKEEKDQIVSISCKYSVLSKFTAFFGQIKNKDKSTEEMKSIEIPILSGRL